MLRRKDEKGLSLAHTAQTRHGGGGGFGYPQAFPVVVLDVVRTLCGEERHRARLGRIAKLDVQRLPGAGFLPFGEGEAVFARIPLGGAIQKAGFEPRQLMMMSLSVRPIVAPARLPGP